MNSAPKLSHSTEAFYQIEPNVLICANQAYWTSVSEAKVSEGSMPAAKSKLANTARLPDSISQRSKFVSARPHVRFSVSELSIYSLRRSNQGIARDVARNVTNALRPTPRRKKHEGEVPILNRDRRCSFYILRAHELARQHGFEHPVASVELATEHVNQLSA